ncbi:FIST N-terminal domain-containing protein [Gallaecimonas kandeliae]|uniref:FIST N-terminal domain-containing protein n=1 Tax=Gallaecimonas kandeliae TaxID=3029055 RepID=UPI002647E328|nr:FIST N-terminal domain-containing protein [Gallaecimonas kandeliae]WKE66317.1 FIST N-terminal domain-containing protein [Gallaecimonas kandeliae]
MFHTSWSLAPDSRLAAVELVRYQPESHKAQWGLLFASGFHQPDGLLAETRRQLGGIPLFGGSCCGIITPAGVEYGGFEALLMLFDSPPDSLCLDQASPEPLAPWLGRDHALCFFDLLGSPLPLETLVPDGRLHGAALLGDFGLENSFVFCGDQVTRNQLVAVKVPAPALSGISHGALPISDPLTVTQASGQQVLTLDGEPALDKLMAITGLDEAQLKGSMLRQLSLGLPWGERYSSHIMVATDSQARSLTLATGQFLEGQPVVLMSRSTDSTFEDMANQLEHFTKDRPSFYINCAGRAGAFSCAIREEAQLVRQHQGKALAGIFSGAELAGTQAGLRLMNWTGVLLQW